MGGIGRIRLIDWTYKSYSTYSTHHTYSIISLISSITPICFVFQQLAQGLQSMVDMCLYGAQRNAQNLGNIVVVHTVQIAQPKHFATLGRQTADGLLQDNTQLAVFYLGERRRTMDVFDAFELLFMHLFQ